MALLQRITKTRNTSMGGTPCFETFIDHKKEIAMSIEFYASDGKKYSLALYKGELEQMLYLLKKEPRIQHAL